MNKIEHYLKLEYPVTLARHVEGEVARWVAEVNDLPGCVSDGATPDEAIENLRDAKELWLETQIELGNPIPEPSRIEDYSGRLLIRMPRSLHQRLASQAQREGVSLNQHLVGLLSRASVEETLVCELREIKSLYASQLAHRQGGFVPYRQAYSYDLQGVRSYPGMVKFRAVGNRADTSVFPTGPDPNPEQQPDVWSSIYQFIPPERLSSPIDTAKAPTSSEVSA